MLSTLLSNDKYFALIDPGSEVNDMNILNIISTVLEDYNKKYRRESILKHIRTMLGAAPLSPDQVG